MKLLSMFLLLLVARSSFALGDFNYLSSQSQDNSRSYLLADGEMDDSYDPFSDYSEFDEASDEEADINFFRNGRFFTVGFAMGLRSFTDELNRLYGSGPTFGLFMSYFFDLRLALELGFQSGDHDFQISTIPTDR